jgi:anti-sigma B factor antagonist
MDQTFRVFDADQRGCAVLAVEGEIDIATAPVLRDRLQDRVQAGESTIVVDLVNVTFLDSTGLGVLVGALKACREAGGDLVLVVQESRIMKLFDITGLADVFSIRRSVDDACNRP